MVQLTQNSMSLLKCTHKIIYLPACSLENIIEDDIKKAHPNRLNTSTIRHPHTVIVVHYIKNII